MTVNDPRQTTLHLLPKKGQKMHKQRAFKYNADTQKFARRMAIQAAKELGHDMTRFGYSQEVEAVQSKCRKCRLQLQDFNFMIHGPALELSCGPAQPVFKTESK